MRVLGFRVQGSGFIGFRGASTPPTPLLANLRSTGGALCALAGKLLAGLVPSAAVVP